MLAAGDQEQKWYHVPEGRAWVCHITAFSLPVDMLRTLTCSCRVRVRARSCGLKF